MATKEEVEEELWQDIEYLIEDLVIIDENPDGYVPITSQRTWHEYQETITELHDKHGVSYYKIGMFVIDKQAKYKAARAEARG